jgi:non-ribosomal peptide synthetase component F
MKAHSTSVTNLPPEPEAIRAKCFHPSGTFVEFPKEEIEQSIPDRFERIVAAHSGRLAVKTNRAELTYDELNRAANRVAHALLARHGSVEEPVLLMLDTSAPMIVSIIGALKAAKIYVPLDPSFPILRHREILEDTAADMIVTDSKNLSLAAELAAGKLVTVITPTGRNGRRRLTSAVILNSSKALQGLAPQAQRKFYSQANPAPLSSLPDDVQGRTNSR